MLLRTCCFSKQLSQHFFMRPPLESDCDRYYKDREILIKGIQQDLFIKSTVTIWSMEIINIITIFNSVRNSR